MPEQAYNKNKHFREGKLRPPAGIALFWYHRTAEAAIFLTLVVGGLYLYNLYIPGSIEAFSLVLPPIVLVPAGLALISKCISRLAKSEQIAYLFSFIGFVATVIMTVIIVQQSGGINSPFIALWMLIAIFAGLYGWYTVLGLFLLVNLALVLDFLNGNPPGANNILMYFMAGEVPLVISFLLWHHKRLPEDKKDNAYSALAHELTQVSNQSEIVIGAIADGVTAIDGRGIIRLINPAGGRILGWLNNDAIGLDYHSVFQLFNKNNQPLPDASNPIWQVLNTNQPVLNDDLTLSTRSGKQMLASLSVSPIGEPGQGVIVVFRDVTKQKAADRERAEFVSTASHEMRTPVAAIEGYLGLAMNPHTAQIDEKARTYLSKAHESAQHLGRLFQDLLDVSRAEDGRLKNDPMPIDVVQFISDEVEMFQTKAAEKGLELKFLPSSSEGDKQKLNPVYFVMADKDHMRELLSNLIENAIKYTLKGSVTVDVSGDPEQVTFSVKDTGIGIAPEDQSHLFQKFYRIDNTDTREIGGTGLGLYLCRRLTEAMNGQIWLESEYKKGTTFYVSIPRLSQEEAQAALQQLESQPVPPPVSVQPAPIQTPATVAPTASLAPPQPTVVNQKT